MTVNPTKGKVFDHKQRSLRKKKSSRLSPLEHEAFIALGFIEAVAVTASMVGWL